MMTFTEAMAFISSFSRGGTPVRDLSRIGGLMEKLGNPQDSLQFLHIAGTNGKGSVAEYLTNILMESGCRVGTFTSPYIRHYRDRIRINREDISEVAVSSACEIIRRYAAPEDGYSQFEITFAIAMLYFTWVQAEPIVLETGVGGLLDCTNIVKNVKACVFTSIGFDHMTVLGDTVEKIAAQKAGIAKPGASLICSPDCGEVVFRLLHDYADRTGKTHFPIVPDTAHETAFRELECDAAHTMFYYLGDIYRTGMGGRYQISNALTAIEAAKALRSEYSVTMEAVQRGLAETYVPGRMQILSEKPLILLDGAHNRDGILRLAEMLREKAVSPAVGIIGMTHADAADYAAQTLGACFDSVLCVDGFTPNAMPAETLCRLFEKYGCHAQSVPLSEALTAAGNRCSGSSGCSIVICGSLYLASWFLNNKE